MEPGLKRKENLFYFLDSMAHAVAFGYKVSSDICGSSVMCTGYLS